MLKNKLHNHSNKDKVITSLSHQFTCGVFSRCIMQRHSNTQIQASKSFKQALMAFWTKSPSCHTEAASGCMIWVHSFLHVSNQVLQPSRITCLLSCLITCQIQLLIGHQPPTKAENWCHLKQTSSINKHIIAKSFCDKKGKDKVPICLATIIDFC